MTADSHKFNNIDMFHKTLKLKQLFIIYKYNTMYNERK